MDISEIDYRTATDLPRVNLQVFLAIAPLWFKDLRTDDSLSEEEMNNIWRQIEINPRIGYSIVADVNDPSSVELGRIPPRGYTESIGDREVHLLHRIRNIGLQKPAGNALLQEAISNITFDSPMPKEILEGWESLRKLVIEHYGDRVKSETMTSEDEFFEDVWD